MDPVKVKISISPHHHQYQFFSLQTAEMKTAPSQTKTLSGITYAESGVL